MIYLENSTEEQTIYIPRENSDIQSIKPISPNIPSDILADYYTKEESNNKFATKEEVVDLSNIIYETADVIVPKIYYIDKNNLSLEDFNNIKNEVNNSKVILNFDGENVEIIKTTDNALYAINCYWVNENDTITYNELSDNGGGSGGGVVNVYNETNSLGIGITQTTKTKTRKSNLSIDEFDEIMTKLSNNERVVIKNMYTNIEIVGFINKPYTEISFMGFSSSTIKGTYLGIGETSNLLIKWVKEDVDGETIVNIKIYNLSYLYNAIDAVQSNSIYTYSETNYSDTQTTINSSLSSTDFEDMVNRFSTQQVAIYNTNGNFKVNIMTIKDNVLYGYYIKENQNFGICIYYNDNGTINYEFKENVFKYYTELDTKYYELKSRIDVLTERITALENK